MVIINTGYCTNCQYNIIYTDIPIEIVAGAIVGGVVVLLVIIVAIIFIIYWFSNRNRKLNGEAQAKEMVII